MSLGLNHMAVIWMPTTKLAPMELRISRDTSSWTRLSPKAKNSAGAAITTSSTENTRRGPQWSSAIPTRMRAGMVSATLAMANSLRSSGVNQFTLFSMLEASGAMPNQTKKQI